MNWYHNLTPEERAAYNKRRIRKARIKRRKMTKEEREVMRAKWRAAYHSRKLAIRSGQLTSH